MNLQRFLGILIMILTVLTLMLELQIAALVIPDLRQIIYHLWVDSYVFFAIHSFIFAFGGYLVVSDWLKQNNRYLGVEKEI